MYVRSDDDSDKRTQNPRTGKRWRASGVLLVQTVAVAPPAMTEITAAMTANVMTVSVTIANAMILSATVDRHGENTVRARPVKRRPKSRSRRYQRKKRSIRKCCVVSVRKETRVYGENACQALFQSRPECNRSRMVYPGVTPRFKEALRWMAANLKPTMWLRCRADKSVRTEHHGGVCFLIKNVTAQPCSSR